MLLVALSTPAKAGGETQIDYWKRLGVAVLADGSKTSWCPSEVKLMVAEKGPFLASANLQDTTKQLTNAVFANECAAAERAAIVEGVKASHDQLYFSKAEKGNQWIVWSALEQGQLVGSKPDNPSLEESLIKAAERGDVERVEDLLAKGADVNAKSGDGWSALMHACYRRNVATVTALLQKGADVNAKRRDGVTALMLAALLGDVNVVQALLDAGADVNAQAVNTGYTALISAAEKGYTSVVKMLLDKGANVNSKNSFGRTALFVAASGGHRRTMGTLLSYGADANIKDNNGTTVNDFVYVR
jgi:hypothetical protein